MSTTHTGRAAENVVAEQLRSEGYTIVSQNWRTKRCEIDIVAKKQQTVYFVEVKYRSSQRQGGGFEYITDKKLQQMVFAAELWVQETGWQGEYCLMAAAVSGKSFQVDEIIEL